MTVIALSGAYGAGGSAIGPALAERLGVPFLDRAIPAAVADDLSVPLTEVEAHDDRLNASRLERILSGFVGVEFGVPVGMVAPTVTPDHFRRATEQVLLRQAETGVGVILGRAATVVLREDPRTLRVRLDGPEDRRVAQAMRLEGIDEDTARRRLRQQDRTHADYLKYFYGVQLGDPALYHLMLDSTALSVAACVQILVTAAEAHAGRLPAGGDGLLG